MFLPSYINIYIFYRQNCFDLFKLQGNNLSFLTEPQTSLPQSVRSQPVVVFRVSDVDEQARKTQL